VVTATDEVELVLDARARIGEGPIWDDREGLLVWVDIERGELHRFDPANGHDECFAVGGQLGAVVPRAKGGYVIARENGYHAYRPGEEPHLLARVEADDPATRINDARCDPAGRIWGGTLEQNLAPGRGALYCLDTDATLRRVLDGVTVSNGLDWSPDGRTMYYVDSHAYAVQAFDFDIESGGLGRARRLVEYPPALWVFPDGMTVDADGFLWVAIFGAGVIHRYAPNGRLERVVRVPARLVTSCGFGSPGLDDLYITSATHVLEPGEAARQPHAGGVFRYRPGVRGRPQQAFAG
jgi:sugar lactone lactonase YvrE